MKDNKKGKEVSPKVTLLTFTPNPEKMIAIAAKLCYSKGGAVDLSEKMTEQDAIDFIDRLPAGHGTPYEHASFSFSIEGISRACSHELVRHRLASHNQRSQRYVSEGHFNFIVPEEIRKSDDYLKIKYKNLMDYLDKFYKDLAENLEKNGLDKKVAFENARYVIPNACETKNIVTMNVRELNHFFNQRCCNRALPEMRDVANQMLAICKKVSPTLFKNSGPTCFETGKCPEGKMGCGKKEDTIEFYKNIKLEG